MPIFDDYREQLKSEIADFTNTGGRPAGSITAAMFLKEFTGGLPWAHLDIAGTAWAEEARPFMPKGATGVAVRTLAELAFRDSRRGDIWGLKCCEPQPRIADHRQDRRAERRSDGGWPTS